MRNYTKVLAWLLVLVASVAGTSAYELTTKDNKVITDLETALFKVFDVRGEKIIWRVLDRIDTIQAKSNNERIVALLEKLEADIDAKYTVGTYALASWPTPILYDSDFKAQFGWKDGNSLNFDDYWEIDAVEHVAVSGTVFEVIKKVSDDVYQVTTKEYPVTNDTFVHGSFLTQVQREKHNDRVKNLPSEEKMIEMLRSIVGVDYVWGWNAPEWIPKLLEVFPPKSEISETKKSQWKLTWVDCSGLLYWISNGNTPRNTSWLVKHGERLDIAWKTLEEITPMLKPLDVIVWRGHMLIVLDEENTVESAVSYTDKSLTPWVQIRKIEDSLWEVMSKRTPVSNYWDVEWAQFVVMRWYK